MATVYRADTIGSLLRPQYLKLAREQFKAGQLAPAAYKEIEDRAVDQAIAMQEGVGLNVVTDGELRRHTFIDQLTEQVEGLTLDSATAASRAPDFVTPAPPGLADSRHDRHHRVSLYPPWGVFRHPMIRPGRPGSWAVTPQIPQITVRNNALVRTGLLRRAAHRERVIELA